MMSENKIQVGRIASLSPYFPMGQATIFSAWTYQMWENNWFPIPKSPFPLTKRGLKEERQIISIFNHQ